MRVKDLGWLAGRWQGTADERQYDEYWLEPADTMMLALSRTMTGGQVVTFEFLRIEERPDGIFYVAQPRGRTPTDFRLTGSTEQSATFENPTHDFPKRIHYQLNQDGSLTARIDGGEGAADRMHEYHFQRLP